MPDITSAEKNGHIRHIVTLQPGEKIMLCRCYKSAKFPICDVSHAKCEGEVGPVIVEAAQPPETETDNA
jgi:CDGSH-type Zn-finger protein